MNLILTPDDEQEIPLVDSRCLGAVIKQLWADRKINAKTFGDENTIWRLEDGLSYPTVKALFKVAEVLRVTPWYILKAAAHQQSDFSY